MGSDPLKDKDARNREQPQHSIDLPEFYIGKYPVTNAQYVAFVRAAGHEVRDEWQNGQFLQGETTHPATFVSWDDAVAFCRWFSWAGDYLIRLPTEAEWEKAARGTDGRIYPWGDHRPTTALCNFGKNEGGSTPVGKYSPQGDSPYGAADMVGNVLEWVSTIWAKKAYPFLVEDEWRTDYLNRTDVLGVLRGGAFTDFVVGDVRCAARLKFDPDAKLRDIGFRVVASPF